MSFLKASVLLSLTLFTNASHSLDHPQSELSISEEVRSLKFISSMFAPSPRGDRDDSGMMTTFEFDIDRNQVTLSLYCNVDGTKAQDQRTFKVQSLTARSSNIIEMNLDEAIEVKVFAGPVNSRGIQPNCKESLPPGRYELLTVRGVNGLRQLVMRCPDSSFKLLNLAPDNKPTPQL